VGDWDFVGLKNFVKIFQTPELVGSLWNTLFLAFGFLIFTNILGLLFALALNRGLKSRYVLRTLVFMPVVVSPIAVSYIWKFIFDYNGPLNQFVSSFGMPKQNWLASPTLAIWCVLVVLVWQNIGFIMVTYLAGLATVPVEMEEAAAIDGAGAFRRFRYVVLPMIQPSVAIATTLTLIQGLRVFDQVVALTNGGPAGATQTLALEVYNWAFTYQQFGFGAALALVLSLLILVFSIGQQYATRDRSQKEA
jgi:raffinose/stachyose/melibiose transport system permease protein